MPTDLHSLRKKIERRARLDTDDFNKWELAEIALDLMRCRPDREEQLAITAKMLEVECRLPFRQIAFSRQMRNAIEANDYVLNARLPRHPLAGSTEQAEGHLYIATAWSRPGLCKLGATIAEPQERLDGYAERYGYPLATFWTVPVRRAFSLEASLRRTLSDRQAPEGAYGDFAGWYRMTPEELQAATERILTGR
jgi:hypothetical protein